MKLITTIILLAMTLFLVQPTVALKSAPLPVHDCCNHKTKDKKESNTKDCNPFVNCCYRTFEVTTNIILKQPVTTEEKSVYINYTYAEHQGFLSSCWHPPRYVVV